MGAQARRHHTLSRFYLKQFADGNDQIDCKSLKSGRIFAAATGNASVVRDFYSIELAGGESSDLFEQWMGKLESQAAEAFTAINEGRWPLPPGLRSALASWIALQYLRSESARRQNAQLEAEFIRILIGASGKEALRRHIEAHERQSISEERLAAEWIDLTKAGGPAIEYSPAQHINSIITGLGVATDAIADRIWLLLVFKRKRLLTSDHPVSMVPGPDREAWRGLGLKAAGGLLLPLSPTLCLLMVSPGGAGISDLSVGGTAQLANEANQSAVGFARNSIYWNPVDRPNFSLLNFPPAREHELQTSNIGSFDERGWSRSIGEVPAAPSSDSSGGVGLSDIGWPIPNRVFSWPTGA